MSTASGDPGSLIVQVITCSKSPKRRLDSALDALRALELDVRTDVVNGYVAEDAVIDTLYDTSANSWRAKRPISRTEVAVYASHRLAWSRFLESGYAAALVFEDDFGLKDPAGVVEVIARRDAILDGGRDIVKLFDFKKQGANRPILSERVGGIELVKWQAPTAGMVAYLITREGAKKMLSRERIFRQVDEDTKYFWELGLDIWSVRENPVLEISTTLGGSMVETERESMKTRRILRSIWGNVLTADRKIKTWIHLKRWRRGRTRDPR